MKKSLAIVGAGIMAAASLAAVQNNASAKTESVTIKTQQQDKQTPVETPAPKQRITANHLGGLDFSPAGSGVSPKYYGQYLQRTGRQKWNKRK